MMDTGSAAKAINPERVKLFANLSNVMLADTMGEIDQLIEATKDRQEAARDEMTRRRLNAIEGARFIVVKAVNGTSVFDSKAVRKEMGDDWYEARQKPGTRTIYTVIARPADEAPVDAADARAAAEALFKVPRS